MNFLVLGVLLAMGRLFHKQHQRILEEIQRMANNDAQLAQADQDLAAAFSGYFNTTNTLIGTLESRLAAIQQSQTAQDDPEITKAAADMEAIVDQMKQATLAAQAAIPTPAASPAAASGTNAAAAANAGTAATAGSAAAPSGASS